MRHSIGVKPRTIVGDRFELLSRVGKGAMGSVHRARDRTTSSFVAVKILTHQEPYNLVRFGREATLLARLHHPNVVDYVAHGESAGVNYLVQAWVEGVTLGEQLHTVGMTAREAVQVATGVAAALDATHALGVIHRDVKPSNIILVDADAARVKLVDFGIARMANEAGVLTRTGMMIGTPSYMAPEQARGVVQLEATADVWALGCVLYEALAGRVAFAGTTPTAIRTKVLLAETMPLAALCPEAPPALLALVAALLSKVPADRPATGADVSELLRALPAVPDGPRRRVGQPEAETRTSVSATATTEPPAGASFVFVTPVEPEHANEAYDDTIARVAARHDMKRHVFEDGSMLLSAPETGTAGALTAARAALEIRREVSGGAVSVFGQGGGSFADAIDRGSLLLERAVMSSLFDGDTIGAGDPVVHLDAVIASAVHDVLGVDAGEHGPILSAGKRTPR